MGYLILNHFDGTDGQTTFTDEVGLYTPTRSGTSALDTGAGFEGNPPKFGTASFQQVGGSLLYEDFNTLPSNWTIDFWFYRHTESAHWYLTFHEGAGITNPTGKYGIEIKTVDSIGGDTNRRVQLSLSTDGDTNDIANATEGTIQVTDNAWHHFALTFTGSNYYFYIDGVLDITVNSSSQVGSAFDSSPTSPTRLVLGNNSAQNASNENYHNIDELRVTNDVQYPDGNSFTPETSAYTYTPPGPNSGDGGDLDLPVKTLAAYQAPEGTMTLPMKTLVAETGGLFASLPMKTLVTGMDGLFDTLPAKTSTGEGSQGLYATLTLPLKEVFALDTTLAGETGTLEAELPLKLTVDGTIDSGAIITATNTLPIKSLEGHANFAAEVSLPLKTIVGSLDSGLVGNANIRKPALTLTADGYSDNNYTGSNTLPLKRITSSTAVGKIGTLDETLPGLRITARGVVSDYATFDESLPLKLIEARGGQNTTSTADITLPLVQLLSDGSVPVSIRYSTYAMNARNGALTKYLNYTFDSYTRFNGFNIAADSNGIYTLGEADTSDDGTDINGLFKTGLFSFGTSYLKRIPRIYVGYKATDTVAFYTITTHDGTRQYNLPANSNTEHQQRRVPVGRGPKSAYWQFEVEGKNGADFSINSLIFYPQVLPRRRVI